MRSSLLAVLVATPLVFGSGSVLAGEPPPFMDAHALRRAFIGPMVYVVERLNAVEFPPVIVFQCEDKSIFTRLGRCLVALRARHDRSAEFRLLHGQWKPAGDSLCVGVPSETRGFCFRFREDTGRGSNFYLGYAVTIVDGEEEQTSVHASRWDVDVARLAEIRGQIAIGPLTLDFGNTDGEPVWTFAGAQTPPATLWFVGPVTARGVTQALAVSQQCFYDETTLERLREGWFVGFEDFEGQGVRILPRAGSDSGANVCHDFYSLDERDRTLATHGRLCVLPEDGRSCLYKVVLATDAGATDAENEQLHELLEALIVQ